MLSAGAHGTIYSLLGRSSVRFAAHGLGVDLPKAPSQADATHHLRLLAARATELSCEVLLTATLSQAEWLGYPIESLEAMLIAYSNATTLAIACQY